MSTADAIGQSTPADAPSWRQGVILTLNCQVIRKKDPHQR
jgi:hypothetical protein